MAGEASQIHNDDVNNLLARCTIEALIPLDTEINLNTLLNDVQSRSSDSDSQALVAKVPQKEIIFLGMAHQMTWLFTRNLRLIIGLSR